jgi:pimeloyl-ACP methyl ester carboxylesterase
VDRRGRGDSGDGRNYAAEREYDDIVAVVDALDPPVLLFGHSFGAICSLEAALRTDRLDGLILYEPPMFEGQAASPEKVQRLEELLATGDREAVVSFFMQDVAGLSPTAFEAIRASPAWTGRVAAAHTLSRELKAVVNYRFDPERAAQLSIPALLLLGGDSIPPYGAVIARLQETLPDARTVVLPGQNHNAMDTGPDLVVDAVTEFWREIG